MAEHAVYKVSSGGMPGAAVLRELYFAALVLIGDRGRERSFDLIEAKVRGTVRTEGKVVETEGVICQKFSADVEFFDNEGTQQTSYVTFFIPIGIVAGAQKTTMPPQNIESTLSDTKVTSEFVAMKPKGGIN